MDYYQIWCNLKDGHKDLEFAKALREYLGRLQQEGRIGGFRLARRKLGFGPSELGEFCITIEVRDLTQLDSAFDLVARRTGKLEGLHAAVYERITDFRSALYRDFPDPQRGATDPAATD